jgi:hypothetical protein
VSDLTTFLRARLNEDQARAEATQARVAADGGWFGARDLVTGAGFEAADAELVAVHADPARVLREVEAKRQIVDEHGDVNGGSCDTCVDGAWGYPTHGGSTPQDYPCRTLRLLASVYADHADYRQEWAA